MAIARALNHVSFAVRDLGRSLAFYRDLLGLAELPRPDFGVPGAWLGVGDAQIHLIQTPAGMDVGSPPTSINPAAGHTAFFIDDFQATAVALRAAGLTPLETSPEQGQMWVQDPDGHVIEFLNVTR
jgi:glyoxylase I family protein